MDATQLNKNNIQCLRTYLANLPDSLPEPSTPRPDLRQFTPKTGVLPGDRAVHEALEDVLGPLNTANFTIKERGLGIQALSDVLERYIEQFPTSLLLQRWLYVAVLAAHNAYRFAGTTPPSLDTSPASPAGAGQTQHLTSSYRSHHPPATQVFGTPSSVNPSGLHPQPVTGNLMQTQFFAGIAGSPAGSPENQHGLPPHMTPRSLKAEPSSKSKGKGTLPQDGQDSQRVKRAKSTKHSEYVIYAIMKDLSLRRLVQSLSTTKPCLRSRSYALRKLPWFHHFMIQDTLLDAALPRFLPSVPIASTPATATSANSSTARVASPREYAVLSDLARKLDTRERTGIYFNTDIACIDFRWMGIEPETSVTLGAHEFLEIGLARTEDYQWLITLRTLDVLTRACGSGLAPQSPGDVHDIPRRDGITLSSLLSLSSSPGTSGWATWNVDWVSIMSGLADNSAVKSAHTSFLSQNALTQMSTFSWDDGPCKLPERHKLDEIFPNLLKEITDVLGVNRFRRDFVAAHSNIRMAATALGFILHQCGTNASSNSDQLLDTARLKDFIVAAQLKAGLTAPATGLKTKDIMYPLMVALFVSPVFLFSKVQLGLAQNARSCSELLETWKLLGNVGRPESLTRIEREIWRLLLRVLGGSDLTACLLSFLEYWRRNAIDYTLKFTDAKMYFKPPPLPSGSSQTSTTIASITSGPISSALSTTENTPLVNGRTPAAEGMAGSSRLPEGYSVLGTKRPAATSGNATESVKRQRLSLTTNTQNSAISAISPQTDYTSPTPSQEDDALHSRTESPTIPPPIDSPSTLPSAFGSTSTSGTPSSTSLLAAVLAEINQLKSERDALRATVEPLRAERDTLETARNDLIGKLAAALSSTAQAERRVQHLDAELKSVRSEAESTRVRLESALAECRTRADTAENRNRSLGEERGHLLERLRVAEEAASKHENRAAALEVEWKRVDSERLSLVSDLHKQIQSLETDLAERTDLMQRAQTQTRKAVSDLNALHQAVHELLSGDHDNATEIPEDTMGALKAELNHLREQASTSDRRIAAADERASDAERRAIDANQRAMDATRRATTTERERAAMEDAHDRRIAYISVLQRRIKVLEGSSWRY